MNSTYLKALAYLQAVDEKEVSISEWDKVCKAIELLESGVSNELEMKLDKAIKDAKHTTDTLEEARKVPDELLHKRFDI